MQNILDGLNEAQKKAVTTTEGPLLVVAGPGTGKTLTIVRRIAYMIQEGIHPENILALTFTTRSAREMQQRATGLLGSTCMSFIGTFHALGLKIIRDTCGSVFSLYSREEQIELLRKIVREMHGRRQLTPCPSYARLAETISEIKNGMDNGGEHVTDIYERYMTAMNERSALDYDDLILKPVELFRQKTAAEKYRDTFRYIIVDEYQDINAPQYNLLQCLAGNHQANVCAVGDADQAIYAFRGADVRNFLNFERDFRPHRRIDLTKNYRSSGTIITAADMLIKNNRKRLEREITATEDEGHPLSLISVPDEKAEAETIISIIEQMMGGTSHHAMRSISGRDLPDSAYSFSDFAVLYRTNAQVRALEEALSLSSIPYQRIGGKNTRQPSSIDETLAFLRSLLTVQQEKTVDDRHDQAERALLSVADFYDPSAEAVTLMTMHMAKGLEFKVVFISGFEDGLIPCTVIDDDIDMEEERRLLYVAMTRAREELILLSSRNRFIFGERLAPLYSPFLREIPDSCITRNTVADRIRKKKEDNQMGLF